MSRIAALAVLAVIVGVGLFAAVQGSTDGGTNDNPAEASVAVTNAPQPAAETVERPVDEPVLPNAPTPDEAPPDAVTLEVEAPASQVQADAAGGESESPDAEATSDDAQLVEQEPDPEAPPILGQEGELVNLDGWLQSDISSLDDLDGTVHVVQFWTFGCYNCKNTLANMAALYERHQDDNFEIVGVHAPEFDYEKDPDAILSAAQSLNVTWPIALDTEKTNFRAWQEARRFWPRTYVIDQNGDIRFDRIGEGKYDELNATVAYLLQNPPPPA